MASIHWGAFRDAISNQDKLVDNDNNNDNNNNNNVACLPACIHLHPQGIFRGGQQMYTGYNNCFRNCFFVVTHCFTLCLWFFHSKVLVDRPTQKNNVPYHVSYPGMLEITRNERDHYNFTMSLKLIWNLLLCFQNRALFGYHILIYFQYSLCFHHYVILIPNKSF